MNNTQYIIERFNKFGFEISDLQADKFNRYYEMLVEWNAKMNLTAITDFKDVVDKHFIDSLCIKRVLDDNLDFSLIDVGTGGGFPGIPIKILFSDTRVTLLDSLQKRINFLDAVIDELELSDIYTIHGRAEDFGRDPEYREKYDICVSRAVANLSTLSEFCLPFVKVNGSFISYKSEKTEEELIQAKSAINKLGGKVRITEEFSIDNNKRTLIVIDKVTATDNFFPRKAGVPLKKPLK